MGFIIVAAVGRPPWCLTPLSTGPATRPSVGLVTACVVLRFGQLGDMRRVQCKGMEANFHGFYLLDKSFERPL